MVVKPIDNDYSVETWYKSQISKNKNGVDCRINDLCKKFEITDFRDFSKYYREDIWMENFGPKSMNGLESILRKMKISFKEE